MNAAEEESPGYLPKDLDTSVLYALVAGINPTTMANRINPGITKNSEETEFNSGMGTGKGGARSKNPI